MEIVTIGNIVVKLVKDGRTIARTHKMQNGSWVVSWNGYYKELPEYAAKEIFTARILSDILSAI